MASDVRAALEAIAAGRSTRAGTNVLAPALIQDNADAFRAWAVFASAKAGEPLAAPTETLTPLP